MDAGLTAREVPHAKAIIATGHQAQGDFRGGDHGFGGLSLFDPYSGLNGSPLFR
jgi:hypothetical protein